MPPTSNILEPFSPCPNEEGYHCAAILRGHEGPVNVVAFDEQGSLLASGGDDQSLRLWDTQTSECVQTFTSSTWGQITTIKFVDFDLNDTGCNWLFFGTGRGRLGVYRRKRKTGTFIEVRRWKLFGPGDSVESFAIDPHSRRVAITSHYGAIRLYRYENTELTFLWGDADVGAIPRHVHFIERGASIMVYGLESGTLWCRDTETSHTKYVRHLQTAIGEVDFCAATDQVLVDNMRDGFDVYPIGRTTPSRSFHVNHTRKYIKGASFSEKGKALVCGSDHGKVYVFDNSDPRVVPPEVLKHGGNNQVIQAIATVSSKEGHLIATAASSGTFEIKVWKKPSHSAPQEPRQTLSAHLLLNIFLVFLIASLTRESWLTPAQIQYHRTRADLEARWANVPSSPIPNLSNSSPSLVIKSAEVILDTPRPSSVIDLAEAIHSLDDASVRKLFGMGPELTEDELRGHMENSNDME